MDVCSLWITNRGLFDTLTDFEYTHKEKEIIQLIFGNTRNLITTVLNNKHNLSYTQQYQLLKILKKPTPKEKTNEMKSNLISTSQSDNDIKTQITLANLHQHCIGYMFTFLNANEANNLSLTSRIIHIASKTKISFPNSEIISFPMHTLYHYIHKILELNNNNSDINSLQLINESDLFSLWMKNEMMLSGLTPDFVLHVVGKSGLLSVFCKLITKKNIIQNHIKVIEHILFMFYMHSQFALQDNQFEHCVNLINSNIIESLSILLQIIIDNDDILTQAKNKIIPYIVCFIHVIYCNHKNAFQSAVWARVLYSSLIENIIIILGRSSWIKYTKHNFLYLTHALSLIRDWILYCKNYKNVFDYDQFCNIILQTIIPEITNRISQLIDVRNSKTWIYEILSEGHNIVIRDPNEDAQYAIDRFRISEILQLSSPNDQNQSITFIGSADIMGPKQKLCVDLDDIHCIDDVNDEYSPYRAIIVLFEALVSLLSTYNSKKNMDFESNNYSDIANNIQQILQISHAQFPYYSHCQNVFFLLKADWQYFIQFLASEIEIEFAQATFQQVYYLMDIAFECGNLNNLCQLQWFRNKYYLSAGEQDLMSLPENWTERILIEIIRNFYDICDSYGSLLAVLMRFDFQIHKTYEYFLSENGVYYVLNILLNVETEHANGTGDNDENMKMVVQCKLILSKLLECSSKPGLFNEEIFGKFNVSNDDIDKVKSLYWVILYYILDDGRNNDQHVKSITREMNWFINKYKLTSLRVPISLRVSFTTVSNQLKALLNELETHQFNDSQINTYLQNVLEAVM